MPTKPWNRVQGFCAPHRDKKEFVVQQDKASICLAEMGLISCRKAFPSK